MRNFLRTGIMLSAVLFSLPSQSVSPKECLEETCRAIVKFSTAALPIVVSALNYAHHDDPNDSVKTASLVCQYTAGVLAVVDVVIDGKKLDKWKKTFKKFSKGKFSSHWLNLDQCCCFPVKLCSFPVKCVANILDHIQKKGVDRKRAHWIRYTAKGITIVGAATGFALETCEYFFSSHPTVSKALNIVNLATGSVKFIEWLYDACVYNHSRLKTLSYGS